MSDTTAKPMTLTQARSIRDSEGPEALLQWVIASSNLGRDNAVIAWDDRLPVLSDGPL